MRNFFQHIKISESLPDQCSGYKVIKHGVLIHVMGYDATLCSMFGPGHAPVTDFPQDAHITYTTFVETDQFIHFVRSNDSILNNKY